MTTDTFATPPAHAAWPDCGARHLQADPRGWHRPTPDYWRAWLLRPELAPVPESCVAERALHEALLHDPLRSVIPGQVEAVADAPDLSERIDSLPTGPGVYLFKSARGKVLYVGKNEGRNRVVVCCEGIEER